MKFLLQRGHIVLTGVFAVFLVIHTIFMFSYNAKVKNYFALEKEVSATETQVSIEPSNLSDDDSADKADLSATSVTADVLQVLLVLAGIGFTYASVRSTMQNRKRLETITQELEESNNTFIFNSREIVDTKDEEAVKARLILNLKKAREFIKAISSGNYGITWEGMNDGNLDANKETLAGELLDMRDQMQRVKEEDQVRIWTTEGLSHWAMLS
jgi:hypothetical protein